MKILFTGGGTGGHVFPIIAVAREIKKIAPGDIELLYIGPKDEWVSLFLSEREGFKIRTIFSGKLRRYLNAGAIFLNILDVFKLGLGILQAFFWIFIESPDLIFSKGGYGSIPVVFGGKILQVPIFLHESDIIPGLSNRFSGKLAVEIFISFPKTEYLDPKKMLLVGNPLRSEVLQGSREKAGQAFGLSGQKPVILILGGSQGAQRINDLLLLILPKILKDFEILHQCGSKNYKEVLTESRVVVPQDLAQFYHLFPFFKEHEMGDAYAAAEVVVSRAGSGSIFEIAVWGKPSILIPLPEAAQAHQLHNAYTYASSGAALVIEESNLTPYFFLEKLRFLISRKDLLQEMSQKAKQFAKPKAAQIIAHYIVEYLKS